MAALFQESISPGRPDLLGEERMQQLGVVLPSSMPSLKCGHLASSTRCQTHQAQVVSGQKPKVSLLAALINARSLVCHPMEIHDLIVTESLTFYLLLKRGPRLNPTLT